MKLLHLSDLHLGKRLSEFSMIEDQAYILNQIVQIIRRECPDGVILAGDIYDKAVPSAEAVQLFDRFLDQMAELNQQVFVISGNHDSAERIAFGGSLMKKSGVYMSPVYDGEIKPITLTDDYGEVNFYLLSFIKPAHVKRFFAETEIGSYNDALKTVVDAMHIDATKRNILVTHQFVTGAIRSDSEEVSVGGSDNVDSGIFDAFDYVALGHIHCPQNVGRPEVRYCGTPLKYSFSEASHQKSVTVVTLAEKGDLTVDIIPLVPLRDLCEIKGTYTELTAKSFYDETSYRDAYMHITLTDEEDIPDAMGKLRVIYRNLMKLDYDNLRTRTNQLIEGADTEHQQSPLELLDEFYEKQNNQPMGEEQKSFVLSMIEEIWEEGR